MKIETQKHDNLMVIQLQGEFTGESVKSFEETVSGVLAGDCEGLILDMSKVILLDSASLEQLIELNERCRERTRQLKLASLDETCRKILEITRLLPRFDTYDEVTDAVKSYL